MGRIEITNLNTDCSVQVDGDAADALLELVEQETGCDLTSERNVSISIQDRPVPKPVAWDQIAEIDGEDGTSQVEPVEKG